MSRNDCSISPKRNKKCCVAEDEDAKERLIRGKYKNQFHKMKEKKMEEDNMVSKFDFDENEIFDSSNYLNNININYNNTNKTNASNNCNLKLNKIQFSIKSVII